ncbi:hypothetical protein CEK62_14410 [Alcanivorax sp. N3-2A]|nr:hypothetical protein CEK62_14410 [Alcanivorax sp. N3-2A]|tara:strand:- start:42819 stop:43562 length:744 start_codon:yes stop_codon:yes gene_type:complete
MTNPTGLPETIAQAVLNETTLPAFPEGLTLARGHALAAQVAERVAGATGGDRQSAFKAGLTDAALQQRLGLDDAMIGHLYASRRLEPGVRLARRGKALIECELAVHVDDNGRPWAVAPALELVRLEFARPGDLTPASLAATNLGADGFVLGDAQPWSAALLDTLEALMVRLYRDDQLVFEARANQSLGGVQQATSWMLERIAALGWSRQGSTLLMTGTVGQALPFQPGEYRADYGALGEVRFSIADR